MEIIYAFGLLLLMCAPAVVPEQVGGFIKRARWRHAFSFSLMIYSFACSMQMSTLQDQRVQDEPVVSDVPYPGPTDQLDAAEEENDPWRCGYEWIVIEGPNGELIKSQIPLICDPYADIYMGCPPELKTANDK